ncbi:MAG TPA: hypothetical protein VFN09_04375 [Rhodanobacteraceae bacterium]|nr:hypothetical protein [Rhodanobacteraceae bacterium]
MKSSPFRAALLVLAAASLGACNAPQGQAPGPASTVPAADSPQLQSDLKMYQGLLARKQYALAAPIGAGLIKRAPHSHAADEVRKTLADAQSKADAINEERRLQGLWLYQTGEQSGGTQHTATIYPSTPDWAHGRVRLILRRHSDWGQSVYLYDTGDAGFVCKGNCKLAFRIDGAPVKALTGYLPETGEPAMFIDHDKAFLKQLEAAHTLDIQVHGKGRDPVDLHFEVAGFDADKWPAIHAAKKPKSRH